ncbi:MAG TPA: CBS domain-containing protein [Thermoanaerobaculia bacterium]|jgi:CBS domain-containing protein|nr:CBS domain-containing protein [Thermoanaerobaculia bacterium]
MALHDKKVRDVMTANPECVSEKDTVRDAARIMARQDTGVVPVLEGRKIIGLITDRDIVVRLIAEGKDPASAHVDDAMSKNVRSVREDAAIDEVLQVMRNAQVRRVPVVNNSNELVGIVSMADVASATRESGKVGDTVEKISEAPPNN